jgi:hypothetical protein
MMITIVMPVMMSGDAMPGRIGSTVTVPVPASEAARRPGGATVIRVLSDSSQ